jgi:tRNA threonylcarbamoyladenosine biosynthesis protein TsaE
MATLISNKVEETLRLGRAWGEEARSGWVIGLRGDLGAGKTQLAKGLAQGLGITSNVHSPTFTLLNEYDGGRLPLFHLDLYRLETKESVAGAGLEEYLMQPRGVCVVEWAERWFDWPGTGVPPGSQGNGFLRLVEMETMEENVRRIRYEDFGD